MDQHAWKMCIFREDTEMRKSALAMALPVAIFFSVSVGYAQDQGEGPADLNALRRLRLLEVEERLVSANATVSAATLPHINAWILSPTIAKNAKGTFGIDLSHYETNNCTIKWPTVAAMGLRYAYLEVTQGENSYVSVVQNWKQLELLHAAKTLFRGAYHFLLPNADLGTDASAQANNFLAAIDAVSNRTPIELPPVLDIEPTKTMIAPGSAEYNSCKRRTSDGNPPTHYYCDMWYKMKPQDIVALALSWTQAVERATGQRVIIYSSPGAWSQVVGASGNALAAERAIWIARYPSSGGPDKDPNWSQASWDGRWNMPALFGGAHYPSPVFNTPDFWQFSETGTLSVNPISCPSRGNPFASDLDFSYIPVKDGQFEAAFGIR